MILYTSGTTGRPKGAVTTHGQIEAHIRSLLEAWKWERDDRILHVLPLHHTHGIVNALCCPLYAGATVEFGGGSGGFDPATTWERLASGDISVFMAVPTIYAKLLRAWDAADGSTRRRWSRGARGLRLMVSGSAALPVPVFKRWEEITGHRLLERYGMTEIGMGLSNPYEGERRPGTVGQPLPGVDLRLVRPATERVLAEGMEAFAPGESGEIRIRGPMVFSEYWRRPEETAAAFVDGWFLTGDEAVLEDGYYRLLGRRSVDNPQERRLQDLGRRDRGSAAHPPGGKGLRRGRNPGRGVGRADRRRGRPRARPGAAPRRAPRAAGSVGPGAARALQGAARLAVRRRSAAERDGQGAKAGRAGAIRRRTRRVSCRRPRALRSRTGWRSVRWSVVLAAPTLNPVEPIRS